MGEVLNWLVPAIPERKTDAWGHAWFAASFGSRAKGILCEVSDAGPAVEAPRVEVLMQAPLPTVGEPGCYIIVSYVPNLVGVSPLLAHFTPPEDVEPQTPLSVTERRLGRAREVKHVPKGASLVQWGPGVPTRHQLSQFHRVSPRSQSPPWSSARTASPTTIRRTSSGPTRRYRNR
jgi:hypothetical protein